MENFKLTGRTFTPVEYKKFAKCVCCGILVLDKCRNNNCKDTDIPCASHFCQRCILIKLDRCKVCTGVFNDPNIKSFTYDIRQDKRWDGFEFKVSKEWIQEFEYYKERVTVPHSDGICKDCFGHERKISNHCYTCGNAFENSIDNSIKNGNMCEFCVFMFDQMEKSSNLSLEII